MLHYITVWLCKSCPHMIFNGYVTFTDLICCLRKLPAMPQKNHVSKYDNSHINLWQNYHGVSVERTITLELCLTLLLQKE